MKVEGEVESNGGRLKKRRTMAVCVWWCNTGVLCVCVCVHTPVFLGK